MSKESEFTKKFRLDVEWVQAKVVLNDKNYAEVVNDLDCALVCNGNNGKRFFLAQKIVYSDGTEYILERYDHEKQTLFYRKIK